MRMLALLCLNFLVVNLIVAVILQDQNNDPVVRLTTLRYHDSQSQVVGKIGLPTFKASGKWQYNYNNFNNLVINWKEGRLLHARADFSKPIPFYSLGLTDKVVLMENNKEWAKVAVPAQGWLFEIDSGGLVLAFEISRPWSEQRPSKRLSIVLFEAGIIPHLAMRQD